MDDTTKLEISKQATLQLKPFLYRRTISFFSSENEGEIHLASGILVSIGHRLFIATASHTVPKLPSAEIWVLSEQIAHSSDQHVPILNRGKHPADDPDVGFLELDANTAREYLKMEACPVERLAVRGVGRSLRSVMLIGNPGELVRFKEHIGPGSSTPEPAINPVVIAYSTVPLMEPEWPDVKDADPGKDIFLDYPKTPAQQVETGEPMFLPNPKGMSGGGLWDQGFETAELWSTDSARLIGIQSSWHPRLRYARCVQIIHWLRLIHSHYQDLRVILEEGFPELATESHG
jgi:hypothetical protein